MCFNLGKFDFLIDPASLVRKAAVKGLGVDETTATILSGDFRGHKDAVKKEEKEQAKKDAANNEAWQRYYASRDASRKTSKSVLTATKSGTVTGGF